MILEYSADHCLANLHHYAYKDAMVQPISSHVFLFDSEEVLNVYQSVLDSVSPDLISYDESVKKRINRTQKWMRMTEDKTLLKTLLKNQMRGTVVLFNARIILARIMWKVMPETMNRLRGSGD